MLEKTVLENMGYWQNGLEIEKKVCDFKVPVGRLGLSRCLHENSFQKDSFGNGQSKVVMKPAMVLLTMEKNTKNSQEHIQKNLRCDRDLNPYF